MALREFKGWQSRFITWQFIYTIMHCTAPFFLLCVINGDIHEFTSIVQKQVSRLWCVWACTRAHREMLPYTQSPWVLCLSSFKWQQPCSYFALCNAHVVCLYTRNAANDPWPPHLTVAVEKQTNKRKSGTSKHVQNATVYFLFRMLKSV